MEPDRGAAIEPAIAAAGKGDVVLIAGKGHETGQYVGGAVIPFDDRVVAGEAWRAAGARKMGRCRASGRARCRSAAAPRVR